MSPQSTIPLRSGLLSTQNDFCCCDVASTSTTTTQSDNIAWALSKHAHFFFATCLCKRMQGLSTELQSLSPITPSDDMAPLIASENARWIRVTDTLIAQLRSKRYENAHMASGLHDFYLFSLAMIDVTAHSFPSKELVEKMSVILPLLPRNHRQKVTAADLTDVELKRIEKRIAKRWNLSTASPKQKRSKSLRV